MNVCAHTPASYLKWSFKDDSYKFLKQKCNFLWPFFYGQRVVRDNDWFNDSHNVTKKTGVVLFFEILFLFLLRQKNDITHGCFSEDCFCYFKFKIHDNPFATFYHLFLTSSYHHHDIYSQFHINSFQCLPSNKWFKKKNCRCDWLYRSQITSCALRLNWMI